VPISTVLALLIAVALNSIKPLQKTLQTIFFLPYVTNSIAIGMVFAAMFNMIGLKADGSADSIGIINNVITFFGGDPINWMNAGSTYAANMAVMIVYIVWNALPFKILILLGGLQSINKQYYDAAKVDGTPKWRVLTRITVPLLSPMLAYVIITGFIGGFKEYSSVVGVFGDKMGPAHDAGSLNTMVGFVYDQIEKDRQGLASAAALILFGIILVVTLINTKVSSKKVHY
jgi:multiple sugar transport system permease protein